MYGIFSLFPIFIILPIYIITVKMCYFPKVTKQNKKHFILTLLLNPSTVYFCSFFVEFLFVKFTNNRNAFLDIFCYIFTSIVFCVIFLKVVKTQQTNNWLNVFIYISFILIFITSSSTIVVNYSLIEAILTTILMPVLTYICYYRIITKKIVLLKESFNTTNVFILNILPILASIIVFFATYIFDICVNKDMENIIHISQLSLCFLNYLTLFFEFIAYHIIFENIEDKQQIKENSEKIIKSQEQLIDAFGEVIANANGETGNHVKRVSEYSEILAKGLGKNDEESENIKVSSILHDVGKIYVPNEILDKPGKLSPEEFLTVKTHVTKGRKLLDRIDGELISKAAVIAEQHHEKWNGQGYLGMKGENISLEARIVAVADVFDALVSKRSYKEGWPIEKAYDLIISESGEHFDPQVVESFKENFEKIADVYYKHKED